MIGQPATGDLPADLTEADVVEAKRIWEDYQQAHDVSGRRGQAAGIDPRTGEVWFGESIMDITDQRRGQALESPLFLVRVGSPTYYRKGGCR